MVIMVNRIILSARNKIQSSNRTDDNKKKAKQIENNELYNCIHPFFAEHPQPKPNGNEEKTKENVSKRKEMKIERERSQEWKVTERMHKCILFVGPFVQRAILQITVLLFNEFGWFALRIIYRISYIVYMFNVYILRCPKMSTNPKCKTRTKRFKSSHSVFSNHAFSRLVPWFFQWFGFCFLCMHALTIEPVQFVNKTNLIESHKLFYPFLVYTRILAQNQARIELRSATFKCGQNIRMQIAIWFLNSRSKKYLNPKWGRNCVVARR